MRQFIAVPLHNKVKQYIENMMEPFRGIKGLKLVKPENLHLTLLFLGDRGAGNKIEELREISFMPFTILTNSVRLFPGRNSRLIWIELEKSIELQGLYDKVASVFGVNAGYKAHITIARIKWLNQADKEVLREKIDHINPCKLTLRVGNFILYGSELKTDGPLYQVIESFPSN